MTELIREREGSLGSRLHRAGSGEYVAYAQWPSRQVWDDSDTIPPTREMVELRQVLRNCGTRHRPDLLMEVLNDQLVHT